MTKIVKCVCTLPDWWIEKRGHSRECLEYNRDRVEHPAHKVLPPVHHELKKQPMWIHDHLWPLGCDDPLCHRCQPRDRDVI